MLIMVDEAAPCIEVALFRVFRSISSLQNRRSIRCGVRVPVRRGYSRQTASSGR